MPLVPVFGVPDRVAAPLSLLVKLTPEGSLPDSEMSIDEPLGSPVVVTAKDPAVPTTKLVELGLVMDGAWVGRSTCQLNMALALALPSVAVTVTE